jgi:outer membrane protein OmpA-like peptidoglycan-associated protein
MNKVVRALVILAVFFLICPHLGQTDILYIKNGDKLFGTIQNPSFAIQTPYGKISIKNELLKSITFENRSVGRWLIRSTNNDQFSGIWLDSSVRFVQDNGVAKEIEKKNVQRLKREIRGPSYPVTTTIFTMKNNDRFSGKLLNPGLKIRANYLTKAVQSDNINRIEFINDYQADIKILLNNGDLIIGQLDSNQIRMAPDVVSEFSVAKTDLKTIQFNAPKMVLKEFSGTGRSEKDSDGDGIPDYADLCSDTPKGVKINQYGCSKKTAIASAKAVQKINAHRAKSNDHSINENRSGDFKNILFDFNKYELKPHYYSVLDEISSLLTQNPKMKIEIQGHTDNIGTEYYNQSLSEKRAQIVKNYFISKGIEQDRLFPVGFGFAMNNSSNGTEAGRALNRRVEFTLSN